MAKRTSGDGWTDKEDSILFTYYCDKTLTELASMLPGRTKYAMRARIGQIGIKKRLRYGELDFTGKRFGKLVAMHKAEARAGDGSIFWMCQCDCGNTHRASSNNLNRGQVKSCGCTHRVRSMEAGFRAFIRSYKTHAKNRGFEWSLSYEFVSEIVKMNCAYCGAPPEQKLISASKGIPLIYNGIDRVDPLLGYTEDNAVPCCGTCNMMKKRHTVKEFLDHITRILNHQASRIDKANPRVEITLSEVE